MNHLKRQLLFSSCVITLFIAGLFATPCIAQDKVKTAPKVVKTEKKEVVKEKPFDFAPIKNEISSLEAQIQFENNDTLYKAIRDSITGLRDALDVFADKHLQQKASQIESLPEYKNLSAILERQKANFAALKSMKPEPKKTETTLTSTDTERTFDDDYPWMKWALIVPGIAAFAFCFFLMGEISRLKKRYTDENMFKIANEAIGTFKAALDAKYKEMKKPSEGDANKGGKGQGSAALIFETAEWKYLQKMIEEDKERKRPKDDDEMLSRKSVEEKPVKKLTLIELYNQAQSREEQAGFRENMQVCSMENSREILEDKQNVIPIFVTENQGTFLIDENTNQMFLNFKVPENRMDIIRLVFQVTGSLPSERQTVSMPAQVQKTAKGWKLVQKGKMEF